MISQPHQIFARLYFQDSCPVCKQAIEFLEKNGINTDCIPLDPITNAGIAALNPHARGISQVPVLVSFLTKKVIYGFNKLEYERLAAAVRATVGAPAPDHAAAAGNHTGAAPPVGAQMETGGQAA